MQRISALGQKRKGQYRTLPASFDYLVGGK
jgi:hypothetical protein